MKRLAQELGIVFLVGLLIMGVLKVVFRSDPLGVLALSVLVLLYTWTLPGYVIVYCFVPARDVLERAVVGTLFGGLFVGALSYYLGLLGWPAAGQHVLPALVAVVALAAFWLRKRF